MHFLARLSLISLLAFGFFPRTSLATTYYLSPSGNDSNPGTLAQPWKSIANLNHTLLHPGDAVLFEGGQTFIGSIVLSGSGTEAHPVYIGSYGQGRATLAAADSKTVIYGENTGGFQIADLNLLGSGTAGNGIAFYADSTKSVRHPGLLLRNVEIANTPEEAISIGSWESANPGWTFVSATGLSVHDNAEGMSTYGYTVPGVTPGAINSIYVGDSEFANNDGSGLVICGAKKGLVDYCSFHDNQATGGCWTWGANNITIQHCLSFNNHRGGGSDGFGFDLDGGSQNCLIQYCLSYNNDTPGFVIFDYTQSALTKNNIIRYCISENDCRCDSEWGSFVIFPWADTAIANCHIFNCVAYLATRGGTTPASGFEAYGKESDSGYGSGRTLGCSFRNNVIVLGGSGSDLRLITGNDGATLPREVSIQNNLYFAPETQAAVYFTDTLYPSLEAWLATHPLQETLGRKVTARYADPLLAGLGTAHLTTSPYLLRAMEAYQPATYGSPCLNSGLNLKKLFHIAPGATDFWGHPLPAKGPFPLGAYEAPPYFVVGL
jgi:hypothetical protein